MKGKAINVGVIGLGEISYSHIPAYQRDKRVRLAAVCDIDEGWAKYRGEALGVERAYADYRDLLANKEIDAVSICLPNALHKEVTVAALEAGKHVLCEKPMAANEREAIAMRDAANKSGRKLMIRQNQRFEAESRLMKRQVESGALGGVYFIRAAWRRPLGQMPSPVSVRENGEVYSRNWFNEKDQSGGVLRDLGCHLIDLAMYVTGFPKFLEASCSCYRKFKTDIEGADRYAFDSEDLAAAHLKFENGLSMEIEVSFGSFVEEEKCFIDIYGTKAGISRVRGGDLRFFRKIDGAYTTETVRKNLCEDKDSIEAFVDCIADDTEPPVTSAQGAAVIRILDAMYASAGKIL